MNSRSVSAACPVDFEVLPDPVRWVVVHTRPRREKKLADAAMRAGIHVYLPLRARTHQYGNRKRTFESPLFSGYVFCRGDMAQRRWLRQNQNVANLLDVVAQQELARQLEQIHLALESNLLVDVMPFLEAGRRVKITAGPLKGCEGIVIRMSGRARVVLNVDVIRQAAVLEVDSSVLAPLS
ncbi:MAG: hypothetical protein NZ740_05100 [Kiritimatiellae bacterium]|nr:hypothetical protein [Kiritimatiellia bacterium]MDW8458470.1 transcription termination/antitermination NusG family protein [Verrucomicrobiota bacterium]